jgi:hypothetical protein
VARGRPGGTGDGPGGHLTVVAEGLERAAKADDFGPDDERLPVPKSQRRSLATPARKRLTMQRRPWASGNGEPLGSKRVLRTRGLYR